MNLLEHSTPTSPGLSPVKEQEKKRPRTSNAVGDLTTNPLFGSAPSEEEGDRTQ